MAALVRLWLIEECPREARNPKKLRLSIPWDNLSSNTLGWAEKSKPLMTMRVVWYTAVVRKFNPRSHS